MLWRSWFRVNSGSVVSLFGLVFGVIFYSCVVLYIFFFICVLVIYLESGDFVIYFFLLWGCGSFDFRGSKSFLS